MDEYHINGLTIKENLLQLAENENKKFTESLHPGIENVLGMPKMTGRVIYRLRILIIWKNVCCKVW